MRHFHDRAIEHLRAAKNPQSYPHYALATHYRESHLSMTPRLMFDVISTYVSELDCRIAEAMQIQREHPQLNLKSESAFVTQLLV